MAHDVVMKASPHDTHRMRRVFRSLGGTGSIGLLITSLILIVAVFAPVLAPHDPLEMHPGDELVAPSGKYLAGTDEYGRDIFSRVLYGARFSLILALLSVGSAVGVGIVLGLVAGVMGGRWDTTIMRLTDTLLAFPPVLIGIMVIAALGTGITQLGVAVFIANIPRFVRLMRANVYREISREYVDAARALGASMPRLMFIHILPNCLSSIVIQSAIAIGNAVLLEAGLSFLGIGAQAPAPSWGAMLKDARQWLRMAPWYGIAPGIALSLLLVGLNFSADAARTALDPKSR